MSQEASLRVLVTEGTSAVGAAVVERLSAEGAIVTFSGRDIMRARTLAASTEALFTERADLGATGAVALVDEASQRLGRLDGLVVACGDAPARLLTETEDWAWDAVLESHVLDPWRLVVASAPALARTRGAVIAIASAADEWPSALSGAHSVAAHALVSLSRMLAAELAPSGVRVNALCPEDAAAPAPPLAGGEETPAAVTASVAFLLSPDGGGCTGMSLVLDGGRRASLTAGAAVAT